MAPMAWGPVGVSPGSRIVSSKGVLIIIVRKVRTVQKDIFHCIPSFRTAAREIQNTLWEDANVGISIAPGREMREIMGCAKT